MSSDSDVSGSSILGLFVQTECLKHVSKFRGPDISFGAKFERPERLHAVLGGVAAGIARLEELDDLSKVSEETSIPNKPPLPPDAVKPPSPGSAVTELLGNLSIGTQTQTTSRFFNLVQPPPPPQIAGSILLNNKSVQIAHSPAEEGFTEYMLGSGGSQAVRNPSSYLDKLSKWIYGAESTFAANGTSELPEGEPLSPGDMYLSIGTLSAIEGSVQTVCQAVDKVCGASGVEPVNPTTTNIESAIQDSMIMSPTEALAGPSSEKTDYNKAFCVIRPPGHHCGESSPSGFCWINNAMVAAVHAYIEHDIDRVIIIDIDLHHGNGTQKIVMSMNRAAVAADKQKLGFRADGKRKRSWRGFYGSVHDIESFPCEDGQEDFVKDASISLAAHGQHIENIHLDSYHSEKDFYDRIYPRYTALLEKAKTFVERTQADPEHTLVLISAGFDACEHEHEGMQRHKRHVPVSFYSSFTRDIVRFADKYTKGKIVSVLEGGYSDMALASAAMGHTIGLLGRESSANWRMKTELVKILKATQYNTPLPLVLSTTPYLARAHVLACHFAGTVPYIASVPEIEPRQLRERRGPREFYTPPQSPARRGRGKATNQGDRPSSGSKSKRRSPASKKSSPKEKQQALPPDPTEPSPKISPVTENPAVSIVDLKPSNSEQDLPPATDSKSQSPSPPLPPPMSDGPSVPPTKVFLRFRNPLQTSSQPSTSDTTSVNSDPSSPESSTPSVPHRHQHQHPHPAFGVGLDLGLHPGEGEDKLWRETKSSVTDSTDSE